MASRRAGGHLVSGHSASAGSDGAAKKRRNVDTRVARTTLTARASRLRMYVSTDGYLPARVAPMVGTRDEPGPPPRQSVQIMRPRWALSSPTYWSSQIWVISGMPLFGLFTTF